METTQQQLIDKATFIAEALKSRVGREWMIKPHERYGVELCAPDARLILETGYGEGRIGIQALQFNGERPGYFERGKMRDGQITVSADKDAATIARDIELRVFRYATDIYTSGERAHKQQERRKAYEAKMRKSILDQIRPAPGYIDCRSYEHNAGIEWRPTGQWSPQINVKLDLFNTEEGERGELKLDRLPLPIVRKALETVIAEYAAWGKQTVEHAAKQDDRAAKITRLLGTLGMRCEFELVTERDHMPWMLGSASEIYGYDQRDLVLCYRVTLVREADRDPSGEEQRVSFYWLTGNHPLPSPLWPGAALMTTCWHVMPALGLSLEEWAVAVGINLSDTPSAEEQQRGDFWTQYHGSVKGPARYEEYRRIAAELRQFLGWNMPAFMALVGSGPSHAAKVAEGVQGG